MNFYNLPHDIQVYINSFDSDFMVKKILIYQKKFNFSINSANKIYQRKIKKFYLTNKRFQKQLKQQNSKKNFEKLLERYLLNKNYQKQVSDLCRAIIKFHCKHTLVIVEPNKKYQTPKFKYYCSHCLQTLARKSLWKDKNLTRKYMYI